MGYTGLNKVNDSDYATMLCDDMIMAIFKVLKKGLKEPTSEFNTGGPENVAMILCEYILPKSVRSVWAQHPEIFQIVESTIKKLNTLIKNTVSDDGWYDGDPEGYDMHLKKYRSWRNRLKRFLESEV